MKVYFGADHRGFALKEKLKALVAGMGHEVADRGALAWKDSDDYPDFAVAVAKEVALAPDESRGILVCGSGAGMDITANRFRKVRCGLALTPEQVRAARRDDDVNVLALAADYIDEAAAAGAVREFLATAFDGKENHRRRLEKVEELGGAA
jgi:ribose 5-phosphate isomerase B